MNLFRYFGAVLAGAWIVLVLTLLGANLYIRYEYTLEMAREQAEESLRKDLVYRHWNAKHGGVYAPISEWAEPNPYLEGLVDHRDIRSDDGRELTLINPAYMTRQAHEIGLDLYGLKGHITSLNVIRPGNEPDDWETRALRQFEDGVEEVLELDLVRGAEHLRMMRPLYTQEACLKCHSHQGYQVGDVRGGLSVAVPMAPFWQVYRSELFWSLASHGVLLLLGLLGLHFGQKTLRRYLQERDQAMVHLKQEVRRYRALVADTPAMICQFLPDGEILYVNESYGKPFNKTPEALVGTSFLDLIPEESRDMVMGNIFALSPDKPMQQHEHAVLLADGSTGWQRWMNRGVFNENGEVECYHAIGSDVTERKKREDRLSQLTAVLDQSPEGVIVTDLEGNIDYVNDAFSRVTGYGAAELHGQNASLLSSGETPSETYREVWNALGQGKTWQGVISNQRKDGSAYKAMARFAAIRNQAGLIINYLSVQTDLTRDRKMQSKLGTQLEELQRWRDLTLNREDRISELKREVNRLLEDAGKPPRYAGETSSAGTAKPEEDE